MNEREKMHENLNRREDHVRKIFNKVRRDVDAGRYDGTQACRDWLEQFAVGEGVNICAGEFTIGDSLGINNDPKAVATDHWAFADKWVADLPPLDYLITNYLECFPDPLRVLQDWKGRLKDRTGVIAIVARDSESYDDDLGPLKNHRRVSCFSMKTLRFYVRRAGYTVFRAEHWGREIRVAAHRG